MTEKIALVFSGIGTHWRGMAESLLANDAVFRDTITEIDALLTPLQGWSVQALLAGHPIGVTLDRPDIAHPAIFSVQIGLTRCLLARRVRPAAVIGHSAGEVAAAWCAGALTLPEAVEVVAAQSALISAVDAGAMLHVALDPATLARRIAAAGSRIELAAINSPLACVVAGPPEAIAAFEAALRADAIDTRLLSIRVPLHTCAVEPQQAAFKARLAGLRAQRPTIALYSSLRGALAHDGDFDADYWSRHIRDTVRFPQAAQALFDAGVTRCIEVSPHPALLQHLSTIAGTRAAAIAFEPTLQRDTPEPQWPADVTLDVTPNATLDAALDAATVEQALRASAADVLGESFSFELQRHSTWIDIGCTSLQITRMMAALSKLLGQRLSITLPYRFPTPAAMIAGLSAVSAQEHTRPALAPSAALAPIAIVGMACRLPGGANDPAALWDLLSSGTDPITEIPPERWPAAAFYDADPSAKGRSVSRWGGFISGQDLRDFDARHFRMTPREAGALDPQQRLLLEVTWEALENAGYSVPELKGKQVGVYVALSTDDYKNSTLYHDIDALDPYAGAGAMSCTAAGRLSYYFGWEGPNLAIDTACSGSIVALHLACQALKSGECDVAVVGGVNALLTPHLYVYFSKAGIMSPTGRCHVFDDAADGYVRAEGCGMLILQRESDAVREARPVRARVLGSALNQDGASSGFSAPNGAAQQKVLRQAWRQAGVSAADIGYLEAHGTGTAIGDSIELEAMSAAVSPQRSASDPMPVGSLKSNLGHLEAAAGLGAVIKTVLALEHRQLPANLHFERPNSHIDWNTLPLRVVDQPQPFPERNGRRVAGISSFGFSGTNAHVVLEQAAQQTGAAARPVQVLALSAPDRDGLRALARSYAGRAAGMAPEALADLAASSHQARPHLPSLPSRLALAASADQIAPMLQRWAAQPADGEQIFSSEGDAGPLVFAFTGQGCQYPGMAQALYQEEPVFRAVLDHCEAALLASGSAGMLSALLDPLTPAATLDATELAQPAIFALQCALAALLAAWGVKPDRVVGHSVGEFAAAVSAGVLTLDDGLALVAQRARLMASMPAGGAMAAVQVDEASALAAIGSDADQVAVAAINGKRAIVLSGPVMALEAVLARLGAPGARAKRLQVSHAYHSPAMARAAQQFAGVASPRFAAASIPWISSVDARDLAGSGPDMAYWAGQITSPVRFDAALDRLEADGCRSFLEIGPAAVLTQMGRARGGANPAFWLPVQERHKDARLSTAIALAALAAHGCAVDWNARDALAGRRRVDLPPYPFQRKRLWREPAIPAFPAGSASKVASKVARPEGAAYPWLNRIALARLLCVLDDASLLDAGRAAPAWRKHLASCLGLLHDAGLLAGRGPFTLTSAGGMLRAGLADLERERLRFLAAHPSLSGCLGLLEECVQHYPAIVRATLDPMTVLFPGGSMERVASVYANNEVQDQFNGHVADTVAQWCAARIEAAPGRPIRIVEIGAGTGSTTAAVLAALQTTLPAGAALDYCFTDISPAFLTRAKARFGALRFRLLNIERAPHSQGFADGEADLIVANNVLHATRDIGATLRHVHALAAPGSALVLNEQTELQPFIHLIFGLTDGWWGFTDALRHDAQSPLLSGVQWSGALQQAGFAVQPGVFSTDAGQAVFIAHVLKESQAMAHAVPASRPADAVATICDMVAELTGMAATEIDPDAALIDLGLDSLMLVQMKTLMAGKLGINVDMADFYGDLDTVSRLAQLVPAGAGALAAPAQAAPLATVHHAPAVSAAMPAPIGAASYSVATPHTDLARLMALQLESMSRMISEQNALLASAPQAACAPPVASATVPVPAPVTLTVKSGTPNFRSLKLDADVLSAAQQSFVDDLARRYAARTPASKALADRSRHTLADWKNTLSFRYSLKEMMYPIVAQTSHGAHFTDLDGNDFLDLTMGCGIALLGHSPESITRAVHAQVDANFAIGPQTALAADVAEHVARITGLERVTFCNTGAEAVMMAIRMARAVTGRTKVVIFNGAYHGTWDGVLGIEHEGQVHPIAAGIPQGMVDDLVILNYGTDEALAALREQAHDIAAVLVEPVQSRRPGFHPAEFLKQLRSITEACGAALIFDEMITGFRILPGGGQAYYGVKADLATYGKIVGGGLPLSVVAGSARFMDVVDGGDWQYGDASMPESDVIYFGGTYVKHPLALAAAKASLASIDQIGLAGYEALNARTTRLASSMNAWFASESVPLTIANFGSLFRIDGSGRFSSIMQPVELDLFFLLMNLRSVYIWERRICFLSFAHTDAEVDHVMACMKEAVLELRAGGFSFRSGGTPPAPGAGTAPPALRDGKGEAASAQRRMFALSEIEGPGVVYNVPLAISMRGPLDLARLQRSLATLVERHPALRTRFVVEDDALVQEVLDQCDATIEQLDCTEAELSVCLDRHVRPFDLRTAPLFRTALLRVSPERHVLLMDAHHIVVDGLSLNILAQELMAAYGGQALPAVGAGMIEYAASERAYLGSDACLRDAQYWRAQFATLPEPLQLPLDQARPLRRRHKGADLLARLDAVSTARLKAAARIHKMPVFPLLLTLYATLLHRVSGQDDIVVGLPVGGRSDPRFDSTVGMLAATLPLRFVASPQDSLALYARACHRAFLGALGHQAYPLETLIAALELPRDTSRNPLFDTMFIYEDGNDRVYRMDGLECEPAPVSRHAAMFDIAIEVVEAEGELTLRCEYDADLFSAATAQGMLELYLRLLHLAPDMLDQPVGQLDLLDARQRSAVLAWGDGGPATPPATILQAFDAQLAHAPDATALICDGVATSYRQLDARANRLAHALQAGAGLTPQSPVALVARRDLGLVAGLLAILRAGAAYVPIDPDFPAPRVRQMFEASRCVHVLASDDLIASVPSLTGARILSLDADHEQPTSAPLPAPAPDHLAYLIFTSGSTGTPKATMVSHANAGAFFASLPQAFGFAPGQRILGVTTASFDIAALELLGSLCCGMTIVLASAHEAREPELLAALIERERVEVVQMTPTRLQMLLDAVPAATRPLPQIRTLLVGGEALPQAMAGTLARMSGTRVFNVYGPTETTIWSAFWQVSDAPVSLGRPFAGERVLLVSPQLRLQPPGAVGQIAISGAGVARGYLDDDQRTAERFIRLPGIDGAVYLTGDLGRWRADGSLEYLGRRDDQVKLRGMRIEIGDIESHLARLPGVTAAAAAVRQNARGEPEIMAWLVGPQTGLDVPAMRSALAASLPAPMIPARFMLLAALPQTPNGKTDRRSLPEPDLQARQGGAPRLPNGPAEQALVDIFSEVLGSPVGPDDDFFLAGGESIRALRLASRIRAAGLAFELQDLFRWPTPAALAAHLPRLAMPEAPAGELAIGSLSGLADDELADLIG